MVSDQGKGTKTASEPPPTANHNKNKRSRTPLAELLPSQGNVKHPSPRPGKRPCRQDLARQPKPSTTSTRRLWAPPQPGSLNSIIRQHPRTRLLVSPDFWTALHLELLVSPLSTPRPPPQQHPLHPPPSDKVDAISKRWLKYLRKAICGQDAALYLCFLIKALGFKSCFTATRQDCPLPATPLPRLMH